MGDGLWVKTMFDGVAAIFPLVGYDGRNDMTAWVIDGYLPADPLSLLEVLRIKTEANDSLSALEFQLQGIDQMNRRIEALKKALTEAIDILSHIRGSEMPGYAPRHQLLDEFRALVSLP